MNYEEMLRRELTLITPADKGAMARAAVYQGTLAKPPGSLGELENIYIRLCGITGTLVPGYTPCRIIVLCADNGVVEEGVSVTPRSVPGGEYDPPLHGHERHGPPLWRPGAGGGCGHRR